MAKKAQVVLVDDLDGTPAEETVTLGLDGRHYEIDLSTANAKALRNELKDYVHSAPRATPPGRSHPPVGQGERLRGLRAGTHPPGRHRGLQRRTTVVGEATH
jgi:hypothetical protein